MANGQRILVRGVNWLGDAVMTTPALLRLREAKPEAVITLLTPAKLAELWRNHPALDGVESIAPRESVWAVGRRLRAKQFDIGLALPNSPRAAMELWWGQVPERIGLARPWRKWFLTKALPARPGAVAMRKRTKKEIEQLIKKEMPVWIETNAGHHQMHHYLHLTASLGASREPLPPKLALPEDAVSRFMEKFKLVSRTEEGSSWFGLNAGAEYGPAKRWPEERFIQAAMQLQRGLRCRWLVFGGAGDKEGAARITAAVRKAYEEQFGLEATAKLPPVFNLAGATSLGELCAGLKLCRVLLTNDSGPMHVAAALGTPVVAVFGSTSPELTGPGLPGDPRDQLLQSHVPCSPCFLRKCPIDFRCMNGISVDQAVWSVMRALG